MPSKNQRIELLEKELQKCNYFRNQYKSLSAVYSNLENRIAILNKLKTEIENISNDIFYYDMLDYLSNVKIDDLNVSQSIGILRNLSDAKSRFILDEDTKYLEMCNKIQKKISNLCLNFGENMIKEDRESYKELREMIQVNSENSNFFKNLENSYFNHRKIYLKKKMKEFTGSVEKACEMLIMGEIHNYQRVFGINLINKYKTEKFPDLELEFNKFEKFIFESMKPGLKLIKLDNAISFINENHEELCVPRSILISIMKIYFNLKTVSKDTSDNIGIIEI